jgi:hypothetical protein
VNTPLCYEDNPPPCNLHIFLSQKLKRIQLLAICSRPKKQWIRVDKSKVRVEIVIVEFFCSQ